MENLIICLTIKKWEKHVEAGVYRVIKDYSTGTKVDGWVLSFFNWYFEHYMDKSEERIENFARTFPEINEVLPKIIKFMVK